MSKCTVVAISGASGSGKTQLATRLVQDLEEQFGKDSIGVICEDFYYRDQSHMPMEEREKTNYDHPNSLEHHLLAQHLTELKAGRAVDMPQYDYHHHTRASNTVRMEPKRVIVLEGILLLADEEMRAQADFLIFVDTPLDICLIRRATRDMTERGRTFEATVTRYQQTVRPMYFQFIEPSRRWADLIVPSWKDNSVAISVLKAKISEYLQDKKSHM